MKKDAFTLVEILVVIAIIGILGSLFTLSLVRNLQRSQFIEAQVAAATALQRGRSLAQRSSQNQAVTWTTDTLTVGAQTLSLPNGATITTPAPTALAYTAPYGELEPAGGQIITLRSANGLWSAEVVLVGVTGKVVRRAVVDN